jgi:signal transduction histidine kinase
LTGSRYPPGPLEALDAFVEVLSEADAGASQDVFYGHLCEVICRLGSMDRGVIFRYDEARRRVRAAGVHDLDIGIFKDTQLSVESAPIARRALETDAVIESLPPEPEDLPARYRPLLAGGSLVCVPLAAAGRWIGVVICDRASGEPLSHRDRHLLWMLGKTAALASMARIATFQGERARELQLRMDVAREIHDGVVQRLFGVSLALGSDGDFPLEERRRAADEIQHALTDLKAALQRPLGRVSRPTGTTLAEEVARLSREHSEFALDVASDSRFTVPAALEPLAQAVLAEALRNAQKHARPTCVGVRAVREDGAFILEVTNDGAGGRGRPTTGMGLRMAAIEALQVGGVVEFGPRAGGRWQVRLVVPVDADE